MRAAVIDIGSNTLRLLICSIDKEKGLQRLKTKRVVTGLARGIVETSSLNPKAKKGSLKTLEDFVSLCKQQRCGHIYALGTSALREALDGPDFVNDIEALTGLKVEILSGQREAELTCGGILDSIAQDKPSLLLDIGGGSVEWILKGPQLIHASIPIGAIKLTERHVRHDPPTEAEINQIVNCIRRGIAETGLPAYMPIAGLQLVATGGTATTIACIDLGLGRYDGNRVHQHRIGKGAFLALIDRFQQAPLASLFSINGLDRKRAGIILAGSLILKAFVDISQAEEIIVSDYGLLEGFLRETFNIIPK